MKTVLVRPLVTEKATHMSKHKVYSFVVGFDANKDSVKQTVESLYKVRVESVRVSIRKGKVKRVGKRMQQLTKPDIKVAYITLKEGEIDIFPKA